MSRKVNNYLMSGAAEGSNIRVHGKRVDQWLQRLDQQIGNLLPKPMKSNLPDSETMYSWVHEFVLKALSMVEANKATYGYLTWLTAWTVQSALMASIVVGLFLPPKRLSWLKTIVHPKFNGHIHCTDKDCLCKERCSGG